jgi:hypothetical protein
MTKLKHLILASALLALPAGATDLPRGYWESGCDPDHFIAVISERTGATLYWNNPTCPAGPGATDSAAESLPAVAAVTGEAPREKGRKGERPTPPSVTPETPTPPVVAPENPTPPSTGNRSGLGDGTNPGRGGGRSNSPNQGINNPNQS